MSFAPKQGSAFRTLTCGLILTVGLLIVAGCALVKQSPTPTSTVVIDPLLFTTPTANSPSTPFSEPSPIPQTTIQINATAGNDHQEDRIVLSFAREGHDHIYAYYPLSQPFVQLTSGEFDDRDPAISPDGTKIAFSSNRNGFWDLYLLDLTNGNISQLTNTQVYDGAPSWSPDGQWLTYETYNSTNFDIVVMPVGDADVPAVQLTQGMGNNFSPKWSPAGREIVFISDRSGDKEIWLARLDVVEDRFLKILGGANASYSSPVWSPDGSSLAWTRTVQGVSTVEMAPLTDIAGGIRSYGSGSDPVWSQDGSALLIQLSDPNAAYLVAYRVQDGVLLFPAEYFPTSIQGTDWRTATLVNDLQAVDPPPVRQPVYPLWQKSTTSMGGITDRQKLVEVPGLNAPYPYLHPAALDPFQDLRDATSRQLGWDFLGTLDDAVLPISEPPQPGISENWLFTGRAINLNSAPLTAGWVSVTREDFGGKVYWRVWVRCLNQDGSCGEPQIHPSWDFSARYNGDSNAYEEGGKTGTIPDGYWVDFSRLALTYGFERNGALGNWRSYFQGTLFNQFVFRQGLSWQEAMLQLYPADTVSTLNSVATLPVNQ